MNRGRAFRYPLPPPPGPLLVLLVVVRVWRLAPVELEEVVHALLISLQRLGPGAQVCLAGAGDSVHPTRRRPPIPKAPTAGAALACFGSSFGTVLSLSLRKHTGAFLRRRGARRAACLRKASGGALAGKRP